MENKILYDLKTIGERIKNARKSAKLTQEDLANELSVRRDRISKMESGEDKHLNLSHLIEMSKLFNCDIGYLLGEYDAQSAAVEKISEITGLSPKAIKTLRKETTGLFPIPKKNYPDFGVVVDFLLCSETGKQFLHHLSDYLFDDVTLRYKGNELEENLSLYNPNRKTEYALNTLDIKAVLLSVIQNDLINLKKENENGSDF